MPNQSNFTPEQIAEILELFFENMAHRQYIGARYVPIFGRKNETSIDWDGGLAPYEPLTIVLYQGNSYTSRQYVPAGIDITNNAFWANTGNYNAQVEAYRAEVLLFDDRITANETAIEDEETARTNADTALQTAITTEETARTNADTALQTAITNEKTARTNADNALNTRINALTERGILLIFGDSWSDLAQGFPNWVTPITNELDFEVKRYAVGGGGWLSGTHVSTQITNALDDLTQSEIERVTHIVIIAGVNDIRNYTDNFVTRCDAIYAEINSCVTTLRANFDARIYIGCNMVGGGYNTNATGFEKCIALGKYIQTRSMAQNIPYMNNFHYMFCPWNDSTVYNDDHLHLGSTGARILGNAVLNCFKGIGIDVTRELRLSDYGMSKYTAECVLKFSNGNCMLGGRFTATEAISENTNTDFSGNLANTFSKLIRCSFLTEDNATLPNMLNLTAVGGGSIAGYLQPRSGGTMRLHNTIALSEGQAMFGQVVM